MGNRSFVCGQGIRGPTRGLGVMHIGVQAVVGPMRFVWRLALGLSSGICHVILPGVPARSDVALHINGLSRLWEAGWNA
jgi:hypothetical protein